MANNGICGAGVAYNARIGGEEVAPVGGKLEMSSSPRWECPGGAALGFRGVQGAAVSPHTGSVLPRDLMLSPTGSRASSGSALELRVAKGVKSREHSLGLVTKGLRRSFGKQLMGTDPLGPDLLRAEACESCWKLGGPGEPGQVSPGPSLPVARVWLLSPRCHHGLSRCRPSGVRMLDGAIMDIVEAQALSLQPQYIHIYSASWGPEDDGKMVDGPGVLAQAAFHRGVIEVSPALSPRTTGTWRDPAHPLCSSTGAGWARLHLHLGLRQWWHQL